MKISFEHPLLPVSTVRFADNDDFSHIQGSSLDHRAPARSSVGQAAHTRTTEPDAFALVLLAGLAMDGQRLAQARSLLEAAYAAYDQCDWGF